MSSSGVSNISLTAQPDDYATQLATLQRQQRLAEMLQQQAAQPIDVQSYKGIQAPVSPFAVLAKALESYTGGAAAYKASKGQAALSKQDAADAATAIKNYYTLPTFDHGASIAPIDPEGVTTTGKMTIGSRPTTPDEQMSSAMQMMGGGPVQQSLGQSLLAENMKNRAVKAPEPFTLSPGQERFDAAGNHLASVAQKPNPNQPFNADGTPNAAYQKYEADKAKAAQAPAWANVQIARDKLKSVESGKIDPDTIDFMASQVLAGDKSPFQNLGRGTQGAENIAALRNRVMTQAKARGLGGADLAALNAEFAGLQAGERTLGTRTANVEMASTEAQQLIPLALSASKAVSRTQYPTINSVVMAAQEGTGDENVVRLGVAVNGLVNTYARAISPTGTPTVSDKDHAREILNKAWSSGQFSAGVDQMQKEIAAARKSPGAVRGEFRGAISGNASGAAAVPDALGGQPAANAATTAQSSPPMSSLKEGHDTTFANGQVWRMTGGKAVRVK